MTRLRLIIAEGNEPMQYVLRRVLEIHHDAIAAVADGQAALDAAKELQPDVILLRIDAVQSNLHGDTVAQHRDGVAVRYR